MKSDDEGEGFPPLEQKERDYLIRLPEVLDFRIGEKRAMTPQFEAWIILFSQINKWGHWHIGGTDFISIGPASSDNGLAWGLLEGNGERIDFKIIKGESDGSKGRCRCAPDRF